MITTSYLFQNFILPIGILVLIIIGYIFLLRFMFKKENWKKQFSPRFQWITNAVLGLISLFISVTFWHNSKFLSLPMSFSENPGVIIGILAGLAVTLWQQKNRGGRWSELYLNFGLHPRDERETMMLLKSTRLAYGATIGMLILLYFVALYTSMPSQSSFIFLILAISMLSRAAFYYSLDRQGFTAE